MGILEVCLYSGGSVIFRPSLLPRPSLRLAIRGCGFPRLELSAVSVMIRTESLHIGISLVYLWLLALRL